MKSNQFTQQSRRFAHGFPMTVGLPRIAKAAFRMISIARLPNAVGSALQCRRLTADPALA